MPIIEIPANKPKDIPTKPDLDSVKGKPEDLPPPAKAEYDAWKAEGARRKDPTDADAPSEAVEFYYEIRARNGCESEVFTDPDRGGYCLSRVLAPALKDEQRILRELGQKPSTEVADGLIRVADVKARHEVPEYVPPVEPEPAPEAEPKVIEKP